MVFARSAFVINAAAFLTLVAGCSDGDSTQADREVPEAHEDSLARENASLEDLVQEIARCRGPEVGERSGGCSRVIYVWSPLMPLSQMGIANVSAATRELKIPITLLDGEALWEWLDKPNEHTDEFAAVAQRDVSPRERETPATRTGRTLASEMIAAGATVHYPAILVYKEPGIVGPAILGFKTKAAYKAMIAHRLDSSTPTDGVAARAVGAAPAGAVRDSEAQTAAPERAPFLGSGSSRLTALESGFRDIEVTGHPEPYFRYIPGSGALAFASNGRNYLLDLNSGVEYAAPGNTDLVSSPDGRYLVTPRTHRGGLEFYDAAWVLSVRALGVVTDPLSVRPFYVDTEMRDQYPSVGILDGKDEVTAYRVLTSWFDGTIHRDYEIRHAVDRRSVEVRALSEPTPTCPAHKLSTPVISKDGQQVAARDEATGTTKIFRINHDMTCEQLLDIGIPTGKVAWDSTGRWIAFAVPRGILRDERGTLHAYGVFVLDRETLSLARVPGSIDVNRLTFPDLVEDTTVIFVVRGRRDHFRLFCCLK